MTSSTESWHALQLWRACNMAQQVSSLIASGCVEGCTCAVQCNSLSDAAWLMCRKHHLMSPFLDLKYLASSASVHPAQHHATAITRAGQQLALYLKVATNSHFSQSSAHTPWAFNASIICCTPGCIAERASTVYGWCTCSCLNMPAPH